MSDPKAATKAVTPIGILSYPHLHAPQLPKDGKGKAKYSATVVFAPGTDLKALEAAALAAAEAKWPGKSTEMLKLGQLRTPFRKDALAKGYTDGSVFINIRTEQQPGIVYSYVGPDGKKPAVMPQEKIREEMYPGANVRASVSAFGYDSNGNKGISFALNNLQKVGEGERLDGRAAADDEFTADLSKAPADISGLI